MIQIPADAEPLKEEGLYAWAETHMGRQITFYLLRQRGNQYADRHKVGEILLPEPPRWREPSLQDLSCRISFWSVSSVGRDFVAGYAEILEMIAHFASVIESTYEDLRKQAEEAEAKREAEYAERRRQQKLEWEERRKADRRRQLKADSRRKYLFDLMKWHLGDRIRCTRDGYRSTVFGTIDKVDERGLHITTEKGKYMFIEFRLVNKMEIKDPDSPRKYDKIYKPGDEPDIQEEEVAA